MDIAIVLVEDFTLEELAGRIMSMLGEYREAKRPVVGVNKA